MIYCLNNAFASLHQVTSVLCMHTLSSGQTSLNKTFKNDSLKTYLYHIAWSKSKFSSHTDVLTFGLKYYVDTLNTFELIQ